MKQTIQLLLLLILFSFHLQGQDSISQIKSKWDQVKSLLQKRSNILIDLTKTLSTVKVDKKQNNNLKVLAIDIYTYVDSLKSIDSLSIAKVEAKNKKVWENIIVTLIEIDTLTIIVKQKFAPFQAKLEGCENNIKNATRDYNEICRKYNRTDLLFTLEYSNKPSEVQF